MAHQQNEALAEQTGDGISLSAECWLEVQAVQLYALPISPRDLEHAAPPLFGLAILVDQANLSEQERAMYESGGISTRPGLHWRFADAMAQWVHTLYQAHLGDIGAWRNVDGTWDAYAISLPTMALANTIPPDSWKEPKEGKAPPLNKTQQHSVERIRSVAQQIEELVSLELQQQSQRRKHSLETLYASLALHAHKLNLRVPALSTYYSPQQYLDHTRAIVRQLPPAPVN